VATADEVLLLVTCACNSAALYNLERLQEIVCNCLYETFTTDQQQSDPEIMPVNLLGGSTLQWGIG